MFSSKIIGTGKFHPDKVMTNDDLSKFLDTNDEWIVQRTGIKERRISNPETEYPSAMAYHASKQAIENAGLEPNDIDLILFSVTIPDMFFPNSASCLQHKLGITNHCGALDINAACTGWLYGVQLTDALIKSGAHTNILLVGCEMTSGFNNWEDRSTCVLFGDGAGAVVMTRAEENDSSKIFHSVLSSDSSKRESLILYKGAAKSPITPEVLKNREQFVDMDGQTVFKNAVKTMAKHCKTVLKESNLTVDDVDWFIPHQANLRIVETTAKLLEFPLEKAIVNVQKYANTSSASIPAALHEAVTDGRIKRGDKILLAAFGAGLTSAAAVLEY